MTRALAVLGRSGEARYLALATNPFRTDIDLDNSSVVNEQLDRFMVNAIRWLTRGKDPGELKVVLAQLDDSYWFKDESSARSWLGTQLGAGPTLNDADSCDGEALAGCLAEAPDLLIVSPWLGEGQDVQPIRDAVRDALAAGIPVLYLHHDGGLNELGEALLELLQVEYLNDNYWHDQRITALVGHTLLGRLPASWAAIRDMLDHLQSGDYDFSLADVAADGDNATYAEQFLAGAQATRALMAGYDARAEDIFARCGNELPKLLALSGDRIRQDIDYPMTVAGTPPGPFLRALFADHAVYNTRANNPEQPDRGSFDSKDLSSVLGRTKTVALTSRRDFRSAGVYMLPGRPMAVTRTDDSAVKTWVFVSSLRSGSTREWDDGYYGGYARPKFLQSARVPIEPGKTVTLTNPYGGPVQVAFDQNDQQVELQFENIGEHAHWRSSADDARFAEAIASGTYDWIEIATDGFELHSRADKIQSTLADARWNTPAKLAEATERYTFDAVHVLAGMQGDGVTMEPEVFGWASEREIDVPVIDHVKHANMDRATCGNGCSGNPYDADWSFSPIGHGDLHELGHSLQRSRFQLTHGALSYPNHAVTNWSPFYAASRYFEDHGGTTSSWSVGHDQLFMQLQAAYQAGERAGDFSTFMDDQQSTVLAQGGDSGIRDCYVFFLQAMAVARSEGKLQNGYHVVPRIHLIDSAFRGALSNETEWTAARAKLGFDQLTLEEATSISNNDFMAIAMSFVTDLDYRDFFAMWGLQISAKADAQIASFGLPAVERVFFAFDATDHTHGGVSTRIADIPKLVIDGTTSWPLP